MGEGMDVEQYMKFRKTLAPASGFSTQYRMIEFASTELINLIDYRLDLPLTKTPLSDMLLSTCIGKRQGRITKLVKSH